MTPREMIKRMADDYFATYNKYTMTSVYDVYPEFYEYLKRRGFTRFQLSALGIGKDINAGDVQQWRNME